MTPVRPLLAAMFFALSQTPPPAEDPMGGVLGGTAITVVLAEARLETFPRGTLAWVAHEVTLAPRARVTHRHVPAFMYALEQGALAVEQKSVTLRSGEAAFVGANVEHSHNGPETIPRPPLQLRFILVGLGPGTETSIHTHPGPEFVYVTRGELIYQSALSDGGVILRVGDSRALPADTAVQKRNTARAPADFLSLFIVDPARPFAPPSRF